MPHYTGVGSRQTPQNILDIMQLFARMMARKGYVLRSGHADGADMAFERGCDQSEGDKEIYIPWYRFNGSSSKLYHIPGWAYDQAGEIIGERWRFLKPPVKKLHARNVLQVMGLTEDDPKSEFLVCWTPYGAAVGGTSTAIFMANLVEIPVINLFNEREAMIELKKRCPGL